MKKVLFTILGFALLSLNAQVKERINYDVPQIKMVVKNAPAKSNAKRDLGTGWFDYAGAYNTFNGVGITGILGWIQPDTNLYTVYTDGTKGKTSFHTLGRINDPRDEVFDNNPARFSRYNSYTWDSIRFTQFYIRFADSMKVGATNVAIVDTLFIQYFLPSGLDNQSYYYQSDPSKIFYYSAPKRDNFNVKTKLNSAAFKTDTVFLTKDWADSISLDGANSRVFGRSLVAPVGATINASATSVNANLVGHTFTFKPMKKPALGDTGIAYDGSAWTNKYNMFAVSLLGKSGVTVENTDQQAQNNSVICNYQVGYGQTLGIWKSYIPGTVFGYTIFEGTDYHLTTQTLSIDNVDANGNGLGNVYPNPSNSASEVFVPVMISETQELTLSISDITGKVIKTIKGVYNAGDFDIAVSTEGMSNGLYTCTLTGAGFKASSKFVLN